MAIENKQNCSPIVVVSEGIHLWHKYVLEPFNGNLITCPAIWGTDIVPGTNLLELSKKPLGLELFSLEDNSRVEIFTLCGDGINYCYPSSASAALLKGLLRL